MRKRIFMSIFLTAFLMIAVSTILLTITLYTDFSTERKALLREEALSFSKLLLYENIDAVSDITDISQSRVSIISSEGFITYDNKIRLENTTNALHLQEVALAFENGYGESTRMSTSLGEENYYYAILLEDGNVLRLAIPSQNVLGILDGSILFISFVIVITIFCSVFMADKLTISILAPLNNLNFDDPLSNTSYDELSPLLTRMYKQNKKITSQMLSLKQKQKEFYFITETMSEALIIFGVSGHILSANKSACTLFGVKNAHNMGYLELCRDPVYIECIEKGFSGNSHNMKYEKWGRIYRLSVTPVENKDGVGAVLLAVDITERELSNNMRQEFSANVSHELKTPLTSILGYADIMRNGIAKPSDFPKFSGLIHDEASRLLVLIQDIIKISHLDEEGIHNQFEELNIYELCERVKDNLTTKAMQNAIAFELKGEAAIVLGIETTLYELIYNLCDNAITYNVPSGKVTINISSGNIVKVTVKDTGIGISEEHKPRIFERFYRVDKSHSKSTGGTGLGLSIVKHAAMLHGATLDMESTLGKGTTVSVSFKRL